MKAIISNGNSKLGKLPNISLTPIKSCPKAPCNKECYALKAYRMYPTVKKAWDNNYKMVNSIGNRSKYFEDIEYYLSKKRPKFFRWHVAGDIPDQGYLDYMKVIARHHRDVKFLAFTKRYDLDFKRLPKNLSIIMSIWPGMPLPKNRLPRAYMQDGTETRVKNAIECPGNCESCGMCWNLKALKKNVVFHKH